MLFRRNWFFLVTFVFAMLGLSWVASGATYNFYFNNTEQGPNSTANPTLTVTDGKAPQATPSGVPSPAPIAANPTTAPAPLAQPAANTSVAQAEPTSGIRTPDRKYFRFGMSGISIAQKEFYTDSYSGVTGQRWQSTFQHGGGQLSLAFFPTRGIGLNLYGGAHAEDSRGQAFAGGELELTPIRFGIFKWDNEVELGALLGASTIRHSEDNWGSLHVGARLAINVTQEFGLTAAARGNAGYRLYEGGLIFRM